MKQKDWAFTMRLKLGYDPFGGTLVSLNEISR